MPVKFIVSSLFCFLLFVSCEKFEHYTIVMTSPLTYGLEEGSPVIYADSEIGFVKRIEEVEDGFRTKLWIDTDFYIPKGSEFIIGPGEGLSMEVQVYPIQSIGFMKNGDVTEGKLSRDFDAWMDAIRGIRDVEDPELAARLDSVVTILNRAIIDIRKLLEEE